MTTKLQWRTMYLTIGNQRIELMPVGRETVTGVDGAGIFEIGMAQYRLEQITRDVVFDVVGDAEGQS